MAITKKAYEAALKEKDDRIRLLEFLLYDIMGNSGTRLNVENKIYTSVEMTDYGTAYLFRPTGSDGIVLIKFMGGTVVAHKLDDLINRMDSFDGSFYEMVSYFRDARQKAYDAE